MRPSCRAVRVAWILAISEPSNNENTDLGAQLGGEAAREGNGDKFHKTLHSRQVVWGTCNLSETSLIFEDLGAGSMYQV